MDSIKFNGLYKKNGGILREFSVEYLVVRIMLLASMILK